MSRKGVLNEYHFSRSKNEGYVYIGCVPKVHGVYKIGRTVDLNSRLASLKREYGDSFCFIYLSDLLYNNVEVEEMLHGGLLNENTTEYFKGEEWFEIGDTHLESIVADIKRCENASVELFAFDNPRTWSEDED